MKQASLTVLQRRRLVTLARWTERVCLIFVLCFMLLYIPVSVLWPLPAAGGDLGSHYWPLQVLMQQGVPNLMLRVWNPGNLFGEPHLLNYFPSPYILMAVLSLALPVPTAFNIGTLLPLLLLPFAAFFFVRQIAPRFPAAFVGMCAALLFVFNESYSMWGGNFLSTLAGQFAHAYGLMFLLLAWGFLEREIRRNCVPFISALLFVAALTSHAYVAVGIPWCLVGSVISGPRTAWRRRLFAVLTCGLLALNASCWFWVPFLQNAPWTTAFSVEWRSGRLLEEAIPVMFYPLLGLGAVSLVAVILDRSLFSEERLRRNVLLFLPLLAGYSLYYLTFTRVGLVDVRAIPQLQLWGLLLAAILFAHLLRRTTHLGAILLVPPLIVGSLWWVDNHAPRVSEWLQWNYSSWQSKPLYPDLMELSNTIRGDFSAPRVAYEHAMVNNGAGTIRVFEMLPYFSGRATLESVYLQASPAAPMAYYIQALISKTPSCPFREFPCPRYDLAAAEAKLRLLGVDTLILSSEELVQQAETQPYLHPVKVTGPWHIYRLQGEVSLVDLPSVAPAIIAGSDWKGKYFSWFGEYPQVGSLLRVRLPGEDQEAPPVRAPTQECHPEVKVLFNALELQTDCVGVLHMLKFSYHPSWASSSGEDIKLLSPGFIGIVPRHSAVRLEFGSSSSWKLAWAWSGLVFIVAGIWWSRKKS